MTMPDPETSRRPPVSVVYALPAPIRTFPLPHFYAHNPISWLSLGLTWLLQAAFTRKPSVEVHRASWDPASGAVVVTNESSMHTLWEQGFFGKGDLSRSEPNWLRRERTRRGEIAGYVAETHTAERREKRKKAKWERAMAQFQAIRQIQIQEKLEDEAKLARQARRAERTRLARGEESQPRVPLVPVGPAELLALPNSERELAQMMAAAAAGTRPAETRDGRDTSHGSRQPQHAPLIPAGPAHSLALTNPDRELAQMPAALEITSRPAEPPADGRGGSRVRDTPPSPLKVLLPLSSPDSWPAQPTDGHDGGGVPDISPGLLELPPHSSSLVSRPAGTPDGRHRSRIRDTPPGPLEVSHSSSSDTRPAEPADGRDSGRIPDTSAGLLELFPRSSSPVSAAASAPASQNSVRFSDPSIGSSTTTAIAATASASSKTMAVSPPPGPLINKEHLQLMPEEAFYLSFGLGALAVADPTTGQKLSTRELLGLFCQHAVWQLPPREVKPHPDNRFLVQYAAYHHYRSLGWVPRGGVKFGVDWLLYVDGPVFDHAEFGIIVVASYTDPWWKQQQSPRREDDKKSWFWLHGIMRVLGQTSKTLVLAHVEVPPPAVFEVALGRNIAAALELYRVREVVVQRWSVNRNRG